MSLSVKYLCRPVPKKLGHNLILGPEVHPGRPAAGPFHLWMRPPGQAVTNLRRVVRSQAASIGELTRHPLSVPRVDRYRNQPGQSERPNHLVWDALSPQRSGTRSTAAGRAMGATGLEPTRNSPNETSLCHMGGAESGALPLRPEKGLGFDLVELAQGAGSHKHRLSRGEAQRENALRAWLAKCPVGMPDIVAAGIMALVDAVSKTTAEQRP